MRLKKTVNVGALTDSELDGLMNQMQNESYRRNKLGNVTLLKSRWGVAVLLLCIAFFILFKAETSAVTDDNPASVESKPGAKGKWMNEPEAPFDAKSKEEDKKEPVVSDSNGNEDNDTTETVEVENEEAVTETTPAPTTPAPETPMPTEAIVLATPAPTDAIPAAPAPTEAIVPATPAPTEATPATQAPVKDKPADDPPANSIYKDFPLNKASLEARKAAFAQGTRPKVRYQYKRRSTQDLTDTRTLEILHKRWGSWTLSDPKAKERPTHDFAKDYPSRDIPWDKFPPNAWQVDKEYLAKYIPEARAHVERALEAMLAEYGWSKYDMPDKTFDERVEQGSFNVEYLNLKNDTFFGGAARKSFKGDVFGGWVEYEYFNGLVRRLMHALLTDDTFTLVMGGHSASAGHGNHFQQSYTLQFFKVMEPVFARLGLKLHATNNGYGGLGTAQSALAAGDMYGREIDILVWDSGMTENSAPAYDLYARQGLLSGNRIPVLLGGNIHGMLKLSHMITPEVGMFGSGLNGVPEVTDHKQAESIIWAARYLRCTSEMHGFCRSMEYNGTCWIERDDYTPVTPQAKEPGGRASWHPGYKQHAIKGRIIAFTVLRALLEGLKQWDEAPDKRLPEEVWHVHDHYQKIRANLAEINSAEKNPDNSCFQYDTLPIKEFCTHEFNGVGEMTPRANPRETAVRNLMKPAYDGWVPVPIMENEYDPPDVFNPALHVPEGEFDYLAVVENGIDFRELLVFDNTPLPAGTNKAGKLLPIGLDHVKPGLGWSADSNANPDECDGSFDGFCGRGRDNNCLLYGHHDHRGGLNFDSYSGWGVFTVPNVKLGIIVIRVEWWHSGMDNPRTVEWTEENNGDPSLKMRHLSAEKPNLRTDQVRKVNTELFNSTKPKAMSVNTTRHLPPVDATADEAIYNVFDFDETGHATAGRMLGGVEICDKFKFEFAVNGKITTWNKDQFLENLMYIQRVVQCQLMLNDTAPFQAGPLDVEFGVRMTGCEKINMFKLSHIYWA